MSIVVIGNTPLTDFVQWFHYQNPTLPIESAPDTTNVSHAKHIVCISTMQQPFPFTKDINPTNPKVMHILANPSFKGFSNPEEFITMQHRDNHEGHPIMLCCPLREEETTPEIHEWVTSVQAAVLHTLTN